MRGRPWVLGRQFTAKTSAQRCRARRFFRGFWQSIQRRSQHPDAFGNVQDLILCIVAYFGMILEVSHCHEFFITVFELFQICSNGFK